MRVMATATLPPQIEIFRAGRHVDDAGNAHNFSDADIAADRRKDTADADRRVAFALQKNV